MITLHAVWHLAAFAIGAAMGSFAALTIVRVPEDQSIVHPPSHCPVCHTPLTWRDNIPIVSWLVLGARCRTCQTPISPLYPLVELLMGLLGWLLWARFVPTPADMDVQHLTAWAGYLLFTWMLVVAAYTDLRARIIPDFTSIGAVPVGVGLAVLLGALGYDGWLDIGWRASVAGAAVAGGFLLVTALLWDLVFGKLGLALGDVKLVAMIGAFVGLLPGALFVLLAASLTGSALGIVMVLVRRRSSYLPFAPALAFGGIAYVLWGEPLVRALLPGLALYL
ncbi:MAG: prepilin peptidase [Alphaproteobacteria bacterium]|nr:prepilin peptidase [Alphaproteobacteria bacterium]